MNDIIINNWVQIRGYLIVSYGERTCIHIDNHLNSIILSIKLFLSQKHTDKNVCFFVAFIIF